MASSSQKSGSWSFLNAREVIVRRSACVCEGFDDPRVTMPQVQRRVSAEGVDISRTVDVRDPDALAGSEDYVDGVVVVCAELVLDFNEAVGSGLVRSLVWHAGTDNLRRLWYNAWVAPNGRRCGSGRLHPRMLTMGQTVRGR